MSKLHIKDAGVWKEVKKLHTRDGGVWKVAHLPLSIWTSPSSGAANAVSSTATVYIYADRAVTWSFTRVSGSTVNTGATSGTSTTVSLPYSGSWENSEYTVTATAGSISRSVTVFLTVTDLN